ncbi:MrcB family domain-containing protein [Desulfovibrio psychrotolerans]|uniref:Type IV methyl-directed restriction enzyme EcoKMcrB subunit DNA-binding domain-containing protein n=1 Tax=Desulfovibrio psychrotolerans TaxID=415242 RepID=A0A7J0BXY1_9BACT|nr:DUF3578 domain-containing protein [Desulfovibrio psychrotolerans]GFM38045.1 hypothetical protein DSM19430T_27290 [Desulfovibrio psychrotolerans]
MLRDVITHIGSNIGQARKSEFANHPLANYIRVDAPAALRRDLGPENSGFRVKGSPGKGRWANSVWLGIFNQRVTHSATVGYYVVYAFSPSGDRVYLALVQGNSSLYDEQGVEAAVILEQRSVIARERIGAFKEYFSDPFVPLGQRGVQARIHEAGYIVGKCYDLLLLPSEEGLLNDLQIMVKAYNLLVAEGGVE